MWVTSLVMLALAQSTYYTHLVGGILKCVFKWAKTHYNTSVAPNDVCASARQTFSVSKHTMTAFSTRPQTWYKATLSFSLLQAKAHSLAVLSLPDTSMHKKTNKRTENEHKLRLCTLLWGCTAEEVDQKEVHVHTHTQRNARLWAFKAPSTISHSHIVTHCSPMGGSRGPESVGTRGFLQPEMNTWCNRITLYMWTCGISTPLNSAVHSDRRRIETRKTGTVLMHVINITQGPNLTLATVQMSVSF